MIGLFQELGPCGVDADGNVFNNPYSWTNASNMLFIDQPTQTGFSYSIPIPGYEDPNTGNIIALPDNTCPDYAADIGCGTYSYPNASLTVNSTDGAAPNFWKTLQGFMGAFPQYSRNEFIFTTESYGGHYGPVFNEYIETQNAKNISGAHPIKLGAVMIGNGWYDPLIQYEAYVSSTAPSNPPAINLSSDTITSQNSTTTPSHPATPTTTSLSTPASRLSSTTTSSARATASTWCVTATPAAVTTFALMPTSGVPTKSSPSTTTTSIATNTTCASSNPIHSHTAFTSTI